MNGETVINITTPSVTLNLSYPVNTDLIIRKLNHIMATQQDAAAQLAKTGATLDKVSAESTAMVQAIIDLKAAAAAAGNITPELQAALDAVASKADSIDALVDDVAPNPTPTPTPAGDPTVDANAP